MKKISFYNMFYMFLLGSIFGWLIEGIYTFVKRGDLINHSAVVIGPFNMIYGICACVLTMILLRFRKSPIWLIFIISFIGGSILEYIMSFGMEKVVGFTAWDYSRYFLNINGRICLLYSIYWGLLGIVWIKFGLTFIEKIINKIDYNFGKKFMIFMLIFLVFDIVLTVGAVGRAHKFDKGIAPKNKYEEVLDKTFNSKYLKNMFNNHWE